MKKPLFIILILFLTPLLPVLAQEKNYAEEKEVKALDIINQEEAEHIPFKILEDVPIHPKCKKLNTNHEKKQCLNTMMIKHVQKHFNANLANCVEKKILYNKRKKKDELTCIGLKPGRKKIFIQFRIAKTGEIEDIKVDAPHPNLEKEGIRIAKLLPKMEPGKVEGKPVRVGYTLPITFNIN